MTIRELHRIFLEQNQLLYTDTRKPVEGGLFFALKGPGFNGNHFAAKALEQGASFVVCDEKVQDADPSKVLYVPNVLECLQHVARFHRDFCESTTILAVGGSNGKTTTKELLHHVLSTTYRVHSTPGNQNNHIGVPLTLLGIKPQTQIAVVELGTNQPGDIELLCSICNPNLALVTNIGKEHLEGFGTVEAIAHEESVLYQYILKNGGHAFFNADDPWIHSMSKRFVNKTMYSLQDYNVLKKVPSIVVQDVNGNTLSSHLAGLHNISNMAAAIAVAQHMQVPIERCIEAIASYVPSHFRSEWIQTKENLLFFDAYNANPTSMKLALETLAELNKPNKWAILGDMFELGQEAASEHQHIVALAQSLGYDKVITVGKHFSDIHHSNLSFETLDDLKKYLKKAPPKGCTLLIKASRGMKMEELIDYL